MKILRFAAVMMVILISLFGVLDIRMEQGNNGTNNSGQTELAKTATTRPSFGNVSGLPESCKTEKNPVYVNLKFQYCFAYPARFNSSESEDGQPSITGPVLEQSVEPLAASLGIITQKAPAGRSLDQIVIDFAGQFAGSNAPDIVETGFALGAQPAVLLEPVPGRGSSRDILLLHKGLVYHLVFFPSPKEFPQARSDLEELFKTVTKSFAFLP